MGGYCAICLSRENINFHHIRYPEKLRKAKLTDIVPLCRRHHFAFHEACKFFGFPATNIEINEIAEITNTYLSIG